MYHVYDLGEDNPFFTCVTDSSQQRVENSTLAAKP